MSNVERFAELAYFGHVNDAEELLKVLQPEHKYKIVESLKAALKEHERILELAERRRPDLVDQQKQVLDRIFAMLQWAQADFAGDLDDYQPGLPDDLINRLTRAATAYASQAKEAGAALQDVDPEAANFGHLDNYQSPPPTGTNRVESFVLWALTESKYIEEPSAKEIKGRYGNNFYQNHWLTVVTGERARPDQARKAVEILKYRHPEARKAIDAIKSRTQ